MKSSNTLKSRNAVSFGVFQPKLTAVAAHFFVMHHCPKYVDTNSQDYRDSCFSRVVEFS